MNTQKVRTTLYLDKQLKKMADMQAVREDTTLQEIFNRALYRELQKSMPSRTRKVAFLSFKLDIPHDLNRADYYEDNH
jgi:hypothetical protein